MYEKSLLNTCNNAVCPSLDIFHFFGLNACEEGECVFLEGLNVDYVCACFRNDSLSFFYSSIGSVGENRNVLCSFSVKKSEDAAC